MVRVDQAGRGQAAGAVDPARPGRGAGGRRTLAHRGDPAAADHDVAAAMLGMLPL